MLHDDTSNMISPTLISNRLPSAGFHDPSPEEREMLYRAAAMQPIIDTEVDSPNVVDADLEKVKPRRNVRISKDPQSVAARHRRQRISSKMRILQKLVPGGNKMDTASMLEEAAHYLKFLKAEVEKMEAIEQLIYARKGRQDFRMQSADFTSANIFQNLARPKNEHELSSSAATRSCTEGLQHPVFRNHNSALQVLPHNYIHHPSLSF
ncbi:hypothetical protein KP509_29G020000 [Ceratopteris richardii]|nr:hypothetical protein KP509_29G020000 [Ceratopteris richardii]